MIKLHLKKADEILFSLFCSSSTLTKWWCPKEAGVHHAAHGPDIGFDPVALFPQNFRGDVVWGSTECVGLSAGPIGIVWHGGGQAEVADLEGHVPGEEHVAKLEISVQDSAPVNVPDAFANLDHEVANLWLRQHLAVLHDMLEIEKETLSPRWL